MARSLAVAVAVVALLPAATPAAVVVVCNGTDRPQTVEVVRPGAKPLTATLAPGRSRAFPVGRTAELTYTAGGRPARAGLTPYHAYVLASVDGTLAVHGVELAAPVPAADDIPAGPPADPPPLKLPIKLLADDAERRTQAVWEKELTARVAAAAGVLEAECGVRPVVAAAAEWQADPAARDLGGLLTDFAARVDPAPGVAAVGFTARPFAPPRGGPDHAAVLLGPLSPHLLLPAGYPRTEAERVELLVHEFGHLLGAVHSPDPLSLMRPSVADGLAASARYRPGFDPLNLLAVHLWVEELRARKGASPRTWADLRPATRGRLRAVYATLARATPDDPVVRGYVAALERADRPADDLRADRPDPPAVAARPAPAPPKPAPLDDTDKLAARADGVRRVIRAVALRAADLAAVPDARPKGDDLTAEYVKAAADVASTLGDDERGAAFLVGLGAALDDSAALRANPVTGPLLRAAESNAERAERLAALGLPTAHGRRDLCRRFFVSAALTELVGPDAAAAAGLDAALLDLDGPAGFGFAGPAADAAGVAFAERVRADRWRLDGFRRGFRVGLYLPPADGLPEGLSAARFAADYGGPTDARLKRELDALRKRAADLPVYQR